MLTALTEYKQEFRLQVRAEFADKYHGANVKIQFTVRACHLSARRHASLPARPVALAPARSLSSRPRLLRLNRTHAALPPSRTHVA